MSPTHEEHAHPEEKSYWIIFAILAVVTAVEVAWSFLGFEGPTLVLPLIGMMVGKFLLVGAVFMHLRFDGKVNGKIFSIVFGTGVVLATLVFIAALATFEFQI